MILRTLINFFSLLSFVSAGGMVLHERRAAPPAGFTSLGAAPADAMITLRVALASKDIAGLQDRLMSVSTPGSSEFRRWLSMDEVNSYIQPSTETLSAFNTFVSANGLNATTISPHRDWLSLSLLVSQANRLFSAQFETFANPSLNATLTRTLSVSLPSELVGHVDVLHPTTAFAGPSSKLVAKARERRPLSRHAYTAALSQRSPESCINANFTTPTCIQDLYGIPATPATQKNNSILVTGYQSEFAQAADLKIFLQRYRPDMDPNTTFTEQSLDKGQNPQDPNDGGAEANLDTQWTVGLATNVPVTFLTVGGGDSDADLYPELLDTVTFLEGLESPPTVTTTSYGDNEVLFGQSLATKICNGYMSLAARGVSNLFASGDGGVRGGHDQISQCKNTTFIPVFPASCPYVTSVGSTDFPNGPGPETASAFSSGTFSNFFATPAYQTDAVSAFLHTLPANFTGIFNHTGRGFPDVAFAGESFAVVAVGGEVTFSSVGTSCSSPGFASVIALINDHLLAAGKPVLGFLNPFLYANAGAFSDVTVGHNSGFNCPNTSVAFDASKGWDPLTGMGTPNFEKLLAAAMA